MRIKEKFYTSIFAQDEGCSISEILAILDFVYNACHDTNDTINHSFMLYHGTFILLNNLHLWIYFGGRGTKFISPTAEATIDSLLSLYRHTYTCHKVAPQQPHNKQVHCSNLHFQWWKMITPKHIVLFFHLQMLFIGKSFVTHTAFFSNILLVAKMYFHNVPLTCSNYLQVIF